MGRIEVKGFWYHGQTIQLDGYKFTGCRFDNCTLRINTTNFELVGCHVDMATTAIQYGPGIPKIIKMFLSRYDWASEKYFPLAFLPRSNPDGTISVDDLVL